MTRVPFWTRSRIVSCVCEIRAYGENVFTEVRGEAEETVAH
jgi:hypothetical protein